MAKDPTDSLCDRQNILNNRYLLQQTKHYLNDAPQFIVNGAMRLTLRPTQPNAALQLQFADTDVKSSYYSTAPHLDW